MTFSSGVHHVGPQGAGLELKLITNRLLNAHLVAIAEAVVAMEQAGLDPALCLEMLRQGAVPRLLDYKAGPMSERDHSPLFTVDLMAKDLGLADERAPAGWVTGAAAAVLRRAQEHGWGPSDISAVIEVLSDPQ
jgi:3-hydroxyisobutyrate dehydrogenase-like beta-hydroxyacid dehydrogenase